MTRAVLVMRRNSVHSIRMNIQLYSRRLGIGDTLVSMYFQAHPFTKAVVHRLRPLTVCPASAAFTGANDGTW
jgi:hypothetical protein